MPEFVSGILQHVHRIENPFHVTALEWIPDFIKFNTENRRSESTADQILKNWVFGAFDIELQNVDIANVLPFANTPKRHALRLEVLVRMLKIHYGVTDMALFLGGKEAH